jgi:hypothetical protein
MPGHSWCTLVRRRRAFRETACTDRSQTMVLPPVGILLRTADHDVYSYRKQGSPSEAMVHWALAKHGRPRPARSRAGPTNSSRRRSSRVVYRTRGPTKGSKVLVASTLESHCCVTTSPNPRTHQRILQGGRAAITPKLSGHAGRCRVAVLRARAFGERARHPFPN